MFRWTFSYNGTIEKIEIKLRVAQSLVQPELELKQTICIGVCICLSFYLHTYVRSFEHSACWFALLLFL